MILELFNDNYKLIIKIMVSIREYPKYLQKYKPTHMGFA